MTRGRIAVARLANDLQIRVEPRLRATYETRLEQHRTGCCMFGKCLANTILLIP
ncbi:hypothetical protein RB576 [Rhodopirellula baltica SH 1]|uniref:Uncharacterized protein n=1 Tax=Rhodopirellula baltica (strain DSM 10527 / NCIMB 13988 / SH1) TaxID=243090 RepID=Q7UYI2_RHOBA|nr:hypothetical protein RB576 [Rhodopirellula baltica SH 1]